MSSMFCWLNLKGMLGLLMSVLRCCRSAMIVSSDQYFLCDPRSVRGSTHHIERLALSSHAAAKASLLMRMPLLPVAQNLSRLRGDLP